MQAQCHFLTAADGAPPHACWPLTPSSLAARAPRPLAAPQTPPGTCQYAATLWALKKAVYGAQVALNIIDVSALAAGRAAYGLAAGLQIYCDADFAAN